MVCVTAVSIIGKQQAIADALVSDNLSQNAAEFGVPVVVAINQRWHDTPAGESLSASTKQPTAGPGRER